MIVKRLSTTSDSSLHLCKGPGCHIATMCCPRCIVDCAKVKNSMSIGLVDRAKVKNSVFIGLLDRDKVKNSVFIGLVACRRTAFTGVGVSFQDFVGLGL